MISRRRANLKRFHILVLDDLGPGGKTGEPPVEPSYKLETSPGSFHFGYYLEPDNDFDRYEAVVQAIHELGFGDKGAGGSYRVVRIPGSANMKPGRDEFRSRITEWEPDRVWTLKSLAKAFGLDIDALPIKSKTLRSVMPGIAAKEGIDPLLVWLSDGGYVVADDGGDFVTITCPWHERHTSGSLTAGYSPLGRGEGEWIQRRGWRCLHEHCSGRGFGALMEWVKAKGGPVVAGVDSLPWLEDLAGILNMRGKDNG